MSREEVERMVDRLVEQDNVLHVVDHHKLTSWMRKLSPEGHWNAVGENLRGQGVSGVKEFMADTGKAFMEALSDETPGQVVSDYEKKQIKINNRIGESFVVTPVRYGKLRVQVEHTGDRFYQDNDLGNLMVEIEEEQKNGDKVNLVLSGRTDRLELLHRQFGGELTND